MADERSSASRAMGKEHLMSTDKVATISHINAGMNSRPEGEALLAAYVMDMRALSFSPKTIKYRIDLIERVCLSARTEPHHLDRTIIARFLGTLDIAASSRRTYYATLRSFATWMLETGWTEHDVMGGMHAPKVPRGESPIVTNDHVQHFLSTRMRPKTRAMALLAIYHGMRVSEVARTRGRDFDRISMVHKVVGKGGVTRYQPVHEAVAEILDDFGDGWWFPQTTPRKDRESGGHILGTSVTEAVGKAMRRARIPGTPHTLRHWYATELNDTGTDIRTIQDLLGHAEIGTTQGYLHVKQHRKRAGVDRLPNLTVQRAA